MMLSNKGRHDTVTLPKQSFVTPSQNSVLEMPSFSPTKFLHSKLGSSVVQELKINQRRILIDSLEIGIPAPEQMIALGERQLPNGVKVGQLLNSKTLNYKKFTPHRDGLFCERIFGPVQSFVCACGKKKESVQNKGKQKDIVKANLLPQLGGVGMPEVTLNKSSPSSRSEVEQNEILMPEQSSSKTKVTPQTEVLFCPKCQVEYINKNVRRHRLGYIKLFAPVTHIWYLKGRPSYLSLFLGKRKKAITSLAYCNAYLVEQIYSNPETQNLLKDTDKSVSTLVEKDNVKIWENSNSNYLNRQKNKSKFSTDFKDSLYSREEEFYLDLPLQNQDEEKSDLDLEKIQKVTKRFDFSLSKQKDKHLQARLHPKNKTDISNDNNKNQFYKSEKEFQNRKSFTNSERESFRDLLVQLFPETFIQNFKKSSQSDRKSLLKFVPSEFKIGVKQSFVSNTDFLSKSKPPLKKSKSYYPFVPNSSFVQQTEEQNINLYNLTNFNNKLAKQNVKLSKLGTKKLRYKVSTRLNAVRDFVETALAVPNQLLYQSESNTKQSFNTKRNLVTTANVGIAKNQVFCTPKQKFGNLNKEFGNIDLISGRKSKNKILRTPYIRAQALPFLPSLICPFHLRDCLISFLQSLPSSEDIPIPRYCQTPRRYPLRDVHKFLAELRSTNESNQAEELTNESIAKFIGFSKERKPIKKPYSDVVKILSVTEKKRSKRKEAVLSKPSFFSDLAQRNRLRSLTKEYKLNSYKMSGKVTALPFLAKANHSQNLVLRIRSFGNTNKLQKTSFFTRECKANTKQSFVTAQQRTYVYPNLILVSALNAKRRFATSATKAWNANKPAYLNETLFKRVPEQEIKRHKVLPKLALLPLGLTCMTNLSLTDNRSVNSLPVYEKDILETAVLNAKYYKNKLLYSKQNSSDLLTPIQLLAQETKLSLRGLLLNTFISMIRDGLTNSSLTKQICTKLRAENEGDTLRCRQKTQFSESTTNFLEPEQVQATETPLCQSEALARQATGCLNSFNFQRFHFLNTHTKPSFVAPSFGTGRQVTNLKSTELTCLTGNQLEKDKNKKSDNLTAQLNQIVPQLETKLFSKKSNELTQIYTGERNCLHSLKEKKELEYKYKTKRFTYLYVPTLLYVQNFYFEKNKVNLTGMIFQLPTLRYKYRSGLTLNIPSKTSVKTGTYNVSTAAVHNAFSYQSQYKSVLNSNLQNLFLKKKIATYQTRLLHIVFGVLPQDVDLNHLTRSKSFLHKNKVLLRKQSNTLFTVPTLGCTYLLTKRQEEKDQSKLGFTLFSKANSKLALHGLRCLPSQNEVLGMRSFGNAQLRFCTAPFLQKLNYGSLLKNLENVKAEAKARLKFNDLKAFSNSNPAKFDEVSCLHYKNEIKAITSSGNQHFGIPEQILPQSRSGVLKVNALLTKQSFECKNKVVAKTKLLHENEKAKLVRHTKQNLVTPTSLGAENVSNWQINGAKEILLYTGGGALESLLKRFNISLFCQFLLGELQILRKYYKNQLIAEYGQNKIVAEHSFDSFETNESNSEVHSSIYTSNSNVVTKHTLDHKERHLGLKSGITDKSTNLFCRRIYRSTRRLKIVQLLMRSKRRPEWMMISVLPVLPPDLRPVLQMGDNLIVASDLNTLYQRVIYRNNRHYKGRFLDFHFVSSIHRLVQDAVDRLIENGKGGSTPFLTPGGRPLKSLSDILKGKRGRFRFNLLGKRVDFSGRSVIVVNPNLKIHECGLPREMALELYKYLLIRQLLLQKRVSSIVNAKKLIKQRKPFIWDILRQIIYYHPLLLNRAPTLHRLGIQAFQPKLTLGNAILLHPLVCAGFNADFDGDQMGVHLPLSPQARAEAWDLLWSRNNLLSPATGQPILLPSQDMVLGFYYMTSLLPYGTANKVSLSHRVFGKNEESKTSDLQLSEDETLINNHFFPKDQINKLSTITTIKSRYNFGVVNQKYKNKINDVVVHVFSDQFQVLYAYQKKQIDIHMPIWLKWPGKSENGEKNQTPLEVRINTFGDRTQIYATHQSKTKMYKNVNTSSLSFYIRTTVGRVLVNNLISKTH